LVKDPQQPQSSSAKTYATVAVRVSAEGDEALFANVIAFNRDATAALLALSQGDSVANAGRDVE
jgi:hypothetical protein